MLQKDETKASRVFGNIYGEVAFMPELKYRANFGVDIYSSSQDTVPSVHYPHFQYGGKSGVGARSNGEDCQRCTTGCLSKR
mgnify:CR=1 FL=1